MLTAILEPTSFSVITGVLCLILPVVYFYIRNRKLPPGPVGLPYFGYWPFLSEDNVYKQLSDLTTKYGDVYCFTVTGKLYLHLGSTTALKEVMVKHSACLQSRCSTYSVLGNFLGKSMLNAVGNESDHLRKFFIKTLKTYGLVSATDDLEDSYLEAVTTTLQQMKAAEGRPLDIQSLLLKNATTTARRILFADNDITNEEFEEILQQFGGVYVAAAGTKILIAGQTAKYIILPFYSSYWQYLKTQKRLDALMSRIVKEHEKTLDEDNPRNVIDQFLIEKIKREKEKDPTAIYFTNKTLMDSIIVLLLDSTLTLSEFIATILLNLTRHPEEQEKIYQEILEFVGPDREPTLQDRNKLQYANAFVYEALRRSEILPYMPSLEFTSETEIRGFKIPKGTVTIFNAYAVNHNPQTFPEPMKFDPSRYLTKGESKRDLPLRFGVGKRSCLGETFSMTHFFLFLVTIVKNFRLTLPSDVKQDTPKWIGVDEFTICAHPR